MHREKSVCGDSIYNKFLSLITINRTNKCSSGNDISCRRENSLEVKTLGTYP